jgi:hypothetical protein
MTAWDGQPAIAAGDAGNAFQPGDRHAPRVYCSRSHWCDAQSAGHYRKRSSFLIRTCVMVLAKAALCLLRDDFLNGSGGGLFCVSDTGARGIGVREIAVPAKAVFVMLL